MRKIASVTIVILYTRINTCYNKASRADLKAGDNMTEKELITFTIDTYMNLQRIKNANGQQENKELDYQLKGVIAKLSSMGVNVEDITF